MKTGMYVKELGRRRRTDQHSGKKRGHRFKREVNGKEGNRTGMESKGRGKTISNKHLSSVITVSLGKWFLQCSS